MEVCTKGANACEKETAHRLTTGNQPVLVLFRTLHQLQTVANCTITTLALECLESYKHAPRFIADLRQAVSPQMKCAESLGFRRYTCTCMHYLTTGIATPDLLPTKSQVTE